MPKTISLQSSWIIMMKILHHTYPTTQVADTQPLIRDDLPDSLRGGTWGGQQTQRPFTISNRCSTSVETVKTASGTYAGASAEESQQQ